MDANTVVEDLNVLADFCPRVSLAYKARVVNKLLLQRPKEAFGDGIVPAVALPAHRLTSANGLQGASNAAGGVLDATVRVEDEPARWPSVAYRHPEGVLDQLCGHSVAHGPADDAPREQVQDDCKVEPT